MKRFRARFWMPETKIIEAKNEMEAIKRVPNEAEELTVEETKEGLMERITCVDVGDACGHLISMVEEMRRKGHLNDERARRYRENVKLLVRQATENPTAPLLPSDL